MGQRLSRGCSHRKGSNMKKIVVAALAVIPLLIRQIGTDRFGTLALVWLIAGYLGIFDLGLGHLYRRYSEDNAS